MRDTEDRLAELRDERGRLAGELEEARAEARDALIGGREPESDASALAERLAALDAAVGELEERLRGEAEARERANRRRRVEAAAEATAARVELAGAVDGALADLARTWEAYRQALRREVGQVSGAGGDASSVERALARTGSAEPLVKALVHAGGAGLARALGSETPVRQRHATALASAEGRVADSLRAELLRLRAESPQRHVAREARGELDALED